MTKKYTIQDLKKADRLYTDGTPMMTDTEYDILKDQVKKLYPNDPYFKTVGAPVFKGKKVDLPFVLGSLDKMKSDTVEKWLEDKGSIIASYKLDGVSFMVTYENGEVVFASTRGDGQEGQDITEKIKYILPKIDYKDHVSLRGELLLTGNDHKDMGFKNRRNGVAGLISKEDVTVENIMKITPIFYELLDTDDDEILNGTEANRLQFIASLGFDVVFHIELPRKTNAVTFLNEMIINSKEMPFDCDGLVLTVNSSIREDVMFPENKVAYKVNTEAVKATVVDVEWCLGRTGKVTPIIHIEPIELDGVTVSKATGFNYEFIASNGIGAGSVIGVVRSGGVIPYITEVFEWVYSVAPVKCPSCGEKLSVIGVDLICNNDDCYDSKVRQIAYFFKTLGADYFTETTVRNLGINSIEEAYELDELDIAGIEGFGIKKAEQIYFEIQKTLKTTPDKLLAAFGISGIGNTLATPILNKYAFDELFTINSVEGIDGVGEILSENLVNNINNFRGLYDFLKEKGLEFTMKEKSNITGMIFTLTGKMPMKRDIITKMIVKKGGMVKGISKSTNYLVTDDPNSGSAKNKKAQSYGTEIIDFNALMELING